jgi:hypothetical protein
MTKTKTELSEEEKKAIARRRAIEFERWVKKMQEKGAKVYKSEFGVEMILESSFVENFLANVFFDWYKYDEPAVHAIDVKAPYVGKEKFKDFLQELENTFEVPKKRIKVSGYRPEEIKRRVQNLAELIALQKPNQYYSWEIETWETKKKKNLGLL